METTPEWNLAVVLAWVVLIHFCFCLFITVVLMATATPAPDGTPGPSVLIWTTFLGLCSTLLAFVQYTPQLLHTYRTKLVGALSIPAMLIQSPGAALMVWTISLRPGTNWTSWLVYAVAGFLQATLLVMCIFWKARQRRLGIDDFGNPLPDTSPQVLINGSTSLGPPGWRPEFGSAQTTGTHAEEAVEAVETTPLIPAPEHRQPNRRKGFLGLFR